MVDYVESPNFGNSNSIAVRMDNLMGYPNDGFGETATARYTIPREHYADRDKVGAKRHLLIIKEVWAPDLNRNATVEDINGNLNPGERNNIKSRETLEAEGAFPPDDAFI